MTGQLLQIVFEKRRDVNPANMRLPDQAAIELVRRPDAIGSAKHVRHERTATHPPSYLARVARNILAEQQYITHPAPSQKLQRLMCGYCSDKNTRPPRLENRPFSIPFQP